MLQIKVPDNDPVLKIETSNSTVISLFFGIASKEMLSDFNNTRNDDSFRSSITKARGCRNGVRFARVTDEFNALHCAAVALGDESSKGLSLREALARTVHDGVNDSEIADDRRAIVLGQKQLERMVCAQQIRMVRSKADSAEYERVWSEFVTMTAASHCGHSERMTELCAEMKGRCDLCKMRVTFR